MGASSDRKAQMTTSIGRRKFIAALGTAAAWPLATRAQHLARAVGWVDGVGERDTSTFRLGMQDSGYATSRAVPILSIRHDGPASLADELNRIPVAVIVAAGDAALAAKAATTSIPIVFYTERNPIKLGLVSSVDRPGGNLTGVSGLGDPMAGKQLQLLHELAPNTDTIAYLSNPTDPNAESDIHEVQTAAGMLGLRLHILNANVPSEIAAAFAALVQEPAEGLLVARNPFFIRNVKLIAGLALNQGVPTMVSSREFVTWSGLMSYGPSKSEWGRQVGVYAGRILNGANPGDLPVVRSTKFELAINLTTARALGLTVPLSQLARADEVIE
jgi:putative tryptophan/tyrosine transport system substrate-binding protein